MGTKGVCLLVVNDDVTCRNIVAEMLQTCTYEELHVGGPLETLNAICDIKERINIVLTNLHRIQSQGCSDVLHHIREKLHLRTFLMLPDDTKVELTGQEISYAAYFLKSMDANDIGNLWELASVNVIENSVNVGAKEEGSGQMASTSQDKNPEAPSRENTSSNADQSSAHRKRKRKMTKEKSEQSEASGDCEVGEKKSRMIWTEELHKKFLEAMDLILPEKPVPKRIVEVMNVPWLKREHVASHLQKYRILVKRAEEKAAASNYSKNIPNYHVGEPSNPPWRSSSSFHSLQRNPIVTLHSYGNPLGMASATSNLHPYSMNSMLSSSSTISNLRPSSMVARNNEGNNQDTFQQLPNPDLSSSSQALLSQKSNYSAYTNSLGSDWRRRMLERQLIYGSRNAVNSGFRIYGDESDRKNMLSSVQTSSSKNSDAALTESCKSIFMGLRLTNGGKSLEFGGTGASKVIITDISSSLRTSGSTTNNFQVPVTTSLQPQNGQYQNQGSGDNYPSNSFGSISQLVNSMENTTSHIPSLPIGSGTSQKHLPSPQDLCTAPGNKEAIQWPSLLAANNSILVQQQNFLPHLVTPAYWDAFVHTLSLPAPSEQQPSLPPSGAPGNGYSASVQYPTTTLNSILDNLPQISVPPSGNNEIAVHYSSSLPAPQQESYVPLSGTSGIDASILGPSTSIQQIPQQESSMPSVTHEVLNSSWPDGNFSALMNDPQMYWDGDFDQDPYFNQLD